MTSSLVGSEMCIRDSPCCPLPVGAWRALRFLFGGPSGPSPQVALRPTYCLLYTSDAADDM
eukprot:722638-Prorocentrum_lima.AAC.1